VAGPLAADIEHVVASIKLPVESMVGRWDLIIIPAPKENLLKGSVLRWVKSSASRWILASDCGAGQPFTFLIRRHLSFGFPFPFITAQLIGEFWKNRLSGKRT
jgi:hypothetical protein